MNWKRAFLVTSVVGVPLIALLAYGMTQNPRDIPSPLPGRVAPVFSRAVFAPGADPLLQMKVGDTVRLAESRGKVVVVNFWASWCLACRDEHQDLSAVARNFAGKGVRFFGLLYNDSEANGERWIAEMGGQAYPGLADPGARTAIDYGLYGVPESFVVDQRGVVAHKYIGPVSGAHLSRLLDSLIVANSGDRAPGQSDAPATKEVPKSGNGK